MKSHQSQNLFSLLEEQNITKKDCLLQDLKSKKGYKRYGGSPLRYGGGKSLAVGKIIEHLPATLPKVVSPFFGGGSVEIAIAKELNVPVQGYDVFELLVNYWQNQIKTPNLLFEKLSNLKNTREEYENIKNILKGTWNKHQGLLEHNLSSIDLATYYFFNHNLSYGPGFLGWMSSIYLDSKKYSSMLFKVKNFKVKNLKVSLMPFE